MDILQSSEYGGTHDELSRLAGELAALFDERSHLLNVVLPNIGCEYQCALGELEHRRFSLHTELLKTKRTIELTQAYLNRREIPETAEIARCIAEEFAAWQEKINEMAAAVLKARFESEYLIAATPEETDECRTLFRAIVRRLHPDIIGEQTEAQKILWMQAQEAYAIHNIAELRALALLLGNDEAALQAVDSSEILRKRIESLRLAADHLRREITGIRTRPPYTLASLLSDPAALQQKRETLERDISGLVVTGQYYAIMLNELQRDWGA